MICEMCSVTSLQKRVFLDRYRRDAKIATHLTDDEKFELYRLAKKNVRTVAVEIGSYLGASSCFIAAGIKKARRHAKLFCIDTWHNDSMSEGKRDTFDEFRSNTLPYTDFIVPLRGSSTEVIPKLCEHFQKIDFLFVDGDHSYEACRNDWELCRQLLSKDAIVVFHDIGWADGVQRVVSEEIAPHAKKHGRLPNLYWAWI